MYKERSHTMYINLFRQNIYLQTRNSWDNAKYYKNDFITYVHYTLNK